MAFCEKLRSGEGNPNLQNVPGKRKDRYINTRAKNRAYTNNGTIWVPDGRQHFDKDVDTNFFEDFEVGDLMTYRSTGGCQLLSSFGPIGFERLTYDLSPGCGDDDPNQGITPPGVSGQTYTYYFYGKEDDGFQTGGFSWFTPPTDIRQIRYSVVQGSFSGVPFSAISGPLPENLTVIETVFGLDALPDVSKPILKPIEAADPDFTFLSSATAQYRFVNEPDGTLWERLSVTALFANFSDTTAQIPIDSGRGVIYSIAAPYPEIPTIPTVVRHVRRTQLASGLADYLVTEYYPSATFIYSTAMFTD